ncbi:hypothetical protein MTO96_000105 [Rhipicephalus appendiculatus]
MSALYRVLTASSKDSNERNGVGEVLAAAATASVTQLPLGRGSPSLLCLLRVPSIGEATLSLTPRKSEQWSQRGCYIGVDQQPVCAMRSVTAAGRRRPRASQHALGERSGREPGAG